MLVVGNVFGLISGLVQLAYIVSKSEAHLSSGDKIREQQCTDLHLHSPLVKRVGRAGVVGSDARYRPRLRRLQGKQDG